MPPTSRVLAATLAVALAIGCGKTPEPGDSGVSGGSSSGGGTGGGTVGSATLPKRTPPTREQLAAFQKRVREAGFDRAAGGYGSVDETLPIYTSASGLVKDTDLSRFPEPPFEFGLNLTFASLPAAKLDALKPSPKLVYLRFQVEFGLQEEAVAVLARHTSLEELYIGSVGLKDTGVAHLKGLTRLRRLDLGGNAFTDAAGAHLTGLRDLEWLNLGGNGHVTEQVVRPSRGCEN